MKTYKEFLFEDTKTDMVSFLSDKKFINPRSKQFLFHGTSISPDKFELRGDYDWEDSNTWGGDLPEGFLFLSTDITEANHYGQYIIPCELEKYDHRFFKLDINDGNYNNPSKAFDDDYGISVVNTTSTHYGFWEDFQESGKSSLIIKGSNRWTVITYIENVIPRVDLSKEFYKI